MNNLLIKNISVPVIVSKIDESLIVSKEFCSLFNRMGLASSSIFIFSIFIEHPMLKELFQPIMTNPFLISASTFFGVSATCNLINFFDVSDKHYYMFSHTVYSHPYSIQYNVEKRDKQLCKFPQYVIDGVIDDVIDDKIVETIKRNKYYIIDEAEKLSGDKKEFEIDLEIDTKLCFSLWQYNAIKFFSNKYEKPFFKL